MVFVDLFRTTKIMSSASSRNEATHAIELLLALISVLSVQQYRCLLLSQR